MSEENGYWNFVKVSEHQGRIDENTREISCLRKELADLKKEVRGFVSALEDPR